VPATGGGDRVKDHCPKSCAAAGCGPAAAGEAGEAAAGPVYALGLHILTEQVDARYTDAYFKVGLLLDSYPILTSQNR
jgi:hypothetical protein